ncbi:hypothetical protein RvY_06972 [Ramazzottius varieornatus]|uniref:Translation initiation factor eIF2B subunit gamma n=1 Tax=Ramazzottius varieornatus TaxID=947166 RepID=A0A1D1VA02_RAMVA|nr:hypothetical protein RvY_06972 [Ramazzottius varieornatus]
MMAFDKVEELQAVVLAAGASSPLEELISTPKSLLSVGRYPLIYYPLKWLQNNGFRRVLLVVSESTHQEISVAVSATSEIDIEIDYVTVPDDDDFGTADSIRTLHNKQKLHSDLLIIPCDIICDLNLQDVANVFRIHDASLAAVYHKTMSNENVIPGTKTKKQHDREIIGLEPVSNRLILSTSEADIDEYLEIRRYLLTRYPRISLRASLEDCHIYLLKKWVLDYLLADPNIGTVRSELIPKLIKKQHQSRSIDFELSNGRFAPSEQGHHADTDHLNRIAAEDNLDVLAREMSFFTDHNGDMEDPYFGNSIRCFAYVAPDESTCLRVKSVASFCEVNRQASKILQQLHPAKPGETKQTLSQIYTSANVHGKALVGQDSLIGEMTKIGEKVSVKRSVIGRNCTIGERSKITMSVIMDDVVIGEGCHIQGSIICSQAHIKLNAELKDCLVGQGYEVSEGSKFANDTLTDEDRLIEI